MKRFFDVVFILLILPLLLPVYLLVALLVRSKLGSPIIFRQVRPGKDAKLFEMVKFRTMSDERDESGELLPNSVRLNKFGKLLRSTSLDELPGLVNVLKGDMSLVGPRPLIVEYLPLYSTEQARRHEVRPGITGWAQVNGRNAISWEHKFELDVSYVENQTFLFDFKILLLTVRKVIIRDGINHSTDVPMPRFMGSNNKEIN
jgi:sugar transferase EpsL